MDFLWDSKINGADLLSYVVGAGCLLYGLRRLRKRPWAGSPSTYVHEPSSGLGKIYVGIDPAGPGMSIWHRHDDKSEQAAQLLAYSWGESWTDVVATAEDQAEKVYRNSWGNPCSESWIDDPAREDAIDAESIDITPLYDWRELGDGKD